MSRKSSFDYADLEACGYGKLFGPGNAQLPLRPMLMFDRITHIDIDGGKHGKGEVRAELDVSPDLWFFGCHFHNDPVMPGCLGLDALWQLVGFHLGWQGYPGRGRALGAGAVRFSGEIKPDASLVAYRVDLKRTIDRGLVMGIAEGEVSVDGSVIYTAEGLRVGLFKQETDSDHES